MEDDDLLTFEKIRSTLKEERNKDTLSSIGEKFFENVKEYLASKKRISSRKSDTEYKNAKNMVEDIIDNRTKKILKFSFLSARSNLEPENLLDNEKKLLDSLSNSIKDHRESLRGSFSEEEEVEEENDSSGNISKTSNEEVESDESDSSEENVEEELSSTKKAEEEKKTNSNENKGHEKDTEGEEILFDGSTSSKASGRGKSSQKEVEEDKVSLSITQKVEEFMGPEMEVHGPFEKGSTIQVGKEVAELLVKQGKAKKD